MSNRMSKKQIMCIKYYELCISIFEQVQYLISPPLHWSISVYSHNRTSDNYKLLLEYEGNRPT